jgi:hypothetical protein
MPLLMQANLETHTPGDATARGIEVTALMAAK